MVGLDRVQAATAIPTLGRGPVARSGFRTPRLDPCPCQRRRLVEFPSQDLLRRQLREVGRNADAAGVEPQQLDLLVRFVRAEDQPQRGLFSRPLLVPLEPTR